MTTVQALDRLKSLLSYNRATGCFRWKVAAGNRKAGDEAGCLTKKGYVVIRVDGVPYLRSRLAWFYVTGEWPKDEIDHKNRRPSDDRWKNLRPADRFRNSWNAARETLPASGHRGVFKNGSGWMARIRHKGTLVHLGTFKSPVAAAAAYLYAATVLRGEYSSL